MCHDLMRAVLDEDVDGARALVGRDRVIDHLDKQLFAEVTTGSKADPSSAEHGLLCYRRRARARANGGPAGNIAEDVVYLATGEIIRHQKSSEVLPMTAPVVAVNCRVTPPETSGPGGDVEAVERPLAVGRDRADELGRRGAAAGELAEDLDEADAGDALVALRPERVGDDLTGIDLADADVGLLDDVGRTRGEVLNAAREAASEDVRALGLEQRVTGRGTTSNPRCRRSRSRRWWRARPDPWRYRRSKRQR
jgi:hypothetical protein